MANKEPKLSLVDLAVANATRAFEAKKAGRTDEERALLEAALLLARKSRKAPNLSSFLQSALADVGNPIQSGRRTAAVAGDQSRRGMVGCGTFEMMFRSQVKDALRGYDGVVGIEFVGTNYIRVRVRTEDDGQRLPQHIRNRPVQWVVVGNLRKRQPR